ncbi:hypothetical protein A3L11_01835 [Thermococcus siculi]|uniref:Uncharacterized protein n=1 Tax=Thermococcus siculi TaxID=72803 RepID=A0A2Z2MHY4_9EURY|nr:hypothetical protein [Thermococcus siculi]ASJ08032.1 hypothetical protein A3L11_01835 [Thermococcus siculi]
MPTPERVIDYYFSIIAVLGTLVVFLSVKYTLRRWRSFPETGWKVRALSMGILGLVLASLVELPAMLLRAWVALAFVAGLAEESVKLIPLKFFENLDGWARWKLVVGTGLFLGLIEGIFYTAGIFVLGQPAYLVVVRLVLIGLHTIWAAVSVGFLLGETGVKRFYGLAFSVIAHALYDLPSLAAIQGYSGDTVAYLAGLSTVFLLVTPLMAKKATEVASALFSPQDEANAPAMSTPEEKF